MAIATASVGKAHLSESEEGLRIDAFYAGEADLQLSSFSAM